MKCVDRGVLKKISNMVYLLFVSIELMFRQQLQGRLTQNLSDMVALWHNIMHKVLHTCVAKSTLIFENEVRWTCSYLSLGRRARPVPFPMSCLYSWTTCSQLLSFTIALNAHTVHECHSYVHMKIVYIMV